MIKKVRLILSGRVQGVGFRFWVKGKVKELGLNGWVRNLETGQVEVVLEGEESLVKKMVSECRQGPMLARVDKMEVFEG